MTQFSGDVFITLISRILIFKNIFINHGVLHGLKVKGDMMFFSKIDKNGRSTIPAEIRKILGLSEQDEIIWIPIGNKIEVMKKKVYSDEEIDRIVEDLEKNALKCFSSEEDKEKLSLQSEAMDDWYLSKLGLTE